MSTWAEVNKKCRAFFCDRRTIGAVSTASVLLATQAGVGAGVQVGTQSLADAAVDRISQGCGVSSDLAVVFLACAVGAFDFAASCAACCICARWARVAARRAATKNVEAAPVRTVPLVPGGIPLAVVPGAATAVAAAPAPAEVLTPRRQAAAATASPVRDDVGLDDIAVSMPAAQASVQQPGDDGDTSRPEDVVVAVSPRRTPRRVAPESPRSPRGNAFAERAASPSVFQLPTLSPRSRQQEAAQPAPMPGTGSPS